MPASGLRSSHWPKKRHKFVLTEGIIFLLIVNRLVDTPSFSEILVPLGSYFVLILFINDVKTAGIFEDIHQAALL